jgi:hypothetical protein
VLPVGAAGSDYRGGLVKAFLWVIGGILVLDALLVAVFAVSAAVVRRRMPRPAAEHDPSWSVEGRHRPRALSAVPSLSDDDDHEPIPIRRHQVRLVSEPVPVRAQARRRTGGHRAAAVATVAAVIFAGTAVANPQVRRFVATAIGTVSGGLTSVTTDPTEQAASEATEAGENSGTATSAPRASNAGGPPTAAHPGGPSTPGPDGDPRPAGVPHQGVFAPDPPSRVVATSAGSGAIVLTWADVSAATSYRVERSSDGSIGWATAASVGQGATTVTDGGLAAGTTYFYRVIAIDSDVESAASDVVSATTALDVPDAPTISATAGGPDRIDLTWTDVGGETGYAVQRSTDEGATWGTIATTGQDVTAASDSGLAPGTTYWYRVVASNAAGDSAPSNVESATTDQPPGSGGPGTGTDLGAEPGSTV